MVLDMFFSEALGFSHRTQHSFLAIALIDLAYSPVLTSEQGEGICPGVRDNCLSIHC